MCLRIFLPTPRRVLLFFIFLILTLSGILSIIPPFQQLFGFPYLLLSDYAAMIAQIIYSYVLACIYAFAYIWLEAGIRKRYPHMNEIMQKKREPVMPVTEEPESKPEPPALPKPVHAKAHVKVHARKHGKKIAKRHRK